MQTQLFRMLVSSWFFCWVSLKFKSKYISKLKSEYVHKSKFSVSKNSFSTGQIGYSCDASARTGDGISAIKRKQLKEKAPRVLRPIIRNNKLFTALQLPKVLNLNPRSLYNKKENFKTFLLEREIDVACVSESW